MALMAPSALSVRTIGTTPIAVIADRIASLVMLITTVTRTGVASADEATVPLAELYRRQSPSLAGVAGGCLHVGRNPRSGVLNPKDSGFKRSFGAIRVHRRSSASQILRPG